MRHTITFTDTATNESRNTWTDWGIIPTQVPVFAPPPVKTNILELPGGDGEIDLTTAITGYPVYGNRQGSFSFLSPDRWMNWFPAYKRIATFLHGRFLRATLDDEPGWYYEGRFSLNSMYCDEQHGTFVMDYDVGPYRWSEQSSADEWLWDPFDFETGVIYNGVYVDTSVTPNKTWQGSDVAQHVPVGTSPALLTLSFDASGDAPLQPSFLVSGVNSILCKTEVGAGDSNLVAWQTLTVGTAKTVPGLILYRGVWLYNGHPIDLYTETAAGTTGTATLALNFRPGRL